MDKGCIGSSGNITSGNGDLMDLWMCLSDATLDECKSLLKKYLTQERFDKLKDQRTKFGGTLADCIRSGCMNLHCEVGIFTCDPDGYTIFADVINDVIKEYHNVETLDHPEPHLGDLENLKFGNLDPTGKYIVSTRIRVGRNYESYGFPPVLTKKKRLAMEATTKAALENLTGDLAGTYHSLETMSREEQDHLIQNHYMFRVEDSLLGAASIFNDWPSGRGIFFNNDKTFLVWVNEEDHLRLISMQKGGDLAAVYKRLCTAIKTMEGSGLPFAKRKGLGYLTFCPTNLGTTLRASVLIKIPHLSAEPDFRKFCENLHLQVRGFHGTRTEGFHGIYDLSNKRRLGLTEFQAVEEMRQGVEICLKREKELLSVTMASVEELWNKLKSAANCKSLLKKHLTEERYKSLKDKKTKFGGGLKDCIQSGCLNPDSGVGIYACDPEGYTVFADVLDEVIKDYHKVDKLDHPEPDMGDFDNLGFGDLDPSGDYIVSTRVRVGRSHDSYGFPPVLSKEQCLKMEEDTKAAFEKFTGELAGKYFPLDGMSKQDQKQMTEDHFLFKDDDRFLRDAGGYKNWPAGRGIFFNNDKTFLVWVNEEDHLRLISMQKGGDLAAVYKRLCTAIKTMQGSGLSFAKRKGLGYLTFCPSNLGTALRASVHMKIPNLAAQPDFKEFCEKLNIQPRGIHGEHTESVGGVYDLSNKRRLGLTEFDAVQEMRRGVEACLAREKELAAAKK
ncbi:arginine kinase-like [Haliotis cracherodii]|uniref:arginine kinase-like n=1 Tax=Haliotis cracherodii TaxID=6455 RepID=UPI0039E9EA83